MHNFQSSSMIELPCKLYTIDILDIHLANSIYFNFARSQVARYTILFLKVDFNKES